MNIYVGNLASEVTEDDLKTAFKAFGDVRSVKIIKDMFSGVSKGFGFVEMPGKVHAQTAMTELNGKDLKGKLMVVNEARPSRDQRRGKKGRRRR
ncbi:RNA recognition motif domain-containing protein [Bacteroidota bacterium]